MATTTELWDALGPEFAGDAQTLKDLFLSESAAQLSPTVFGARYQRAAVYLALHMRSMASRGARGIEGCGPVTSERAGDLAVAYGPSLSGLASAAGLGAADADLAATRYGLAFLGQRQAVCGGPRVVTSDPVGEA